MSKAVVRYIHWRDAPAPRDDPDAVIVEFGPDRGPALAGEVVELIRQARDLPVDWSTTTLSQGGDEMRSAFAARHWELNREALDALRWKWTFEWR